ATGFGNKIAGFVGELAQGEKTKIELTANKEALTPYVKELDNILENKKNFALRGIMYPKDGNIVAIDEANKKTMFGLLDFESVEGKKATMAILKEHNVSEEKPFHISLKFMMD